MSEISKKRTEILRKYQKNIYESRKEKRIGRAVMSCDVLDDTVFNSMMSINTDVI